MPYSMLLKTARRQAGASLREVAARVCISPSTLYRYEEGLILRIPPEILKSLFALYRITPQEDFHLYRREQEEKRLAQYGESRLNVSADFLYRQYEQLDQRGKKNVLNLLKYELSLQEKPFSSGSQ